MEGRRKESTSPSVKLQEQIQLLVPVYNEGAGIVKLYERIIAEKVPFDVLRIVYDSPKDTTVPYIEELANKDQRVIGEHNQFGKGVVHALRWGFKQSKPGPVIVLMADLSDKLSIIPEMLARWQAGDTVVCPSRYMPGGAQHGGPLLKGLLSKTAGRSLKLFGFPTADATNNYKLYDGTWLSTIEIESSGGFEIAIELCYKAFRQGKKLSEVPSEWWDRTEGESNFKLFSWLPRYLSWYLKIVRELFLARAGTSPASREIR